MQLIHLANYVRHNCLEVNSAMGRAESFLILNGKSYSAGKKFISETNFIVSNVSSEYSVLFLNGLADPSLVFLIIS